MNLPWLFFAAALLAGTLITVQTGGNARLKEAFGGSWAVCSWWSGSS